MEGAAVIDRVHNNVNCLASIDKALDFGIKGAKLVLSSAGSWTLVYHSPTQGRVNAVDQRTGENTGKVGVIPVTRLHGWGYRIDDGGIRF